MKYLVMCPECNSTNLKKVKIVYGKNTNGERYEDGFICNDCNCEIELSDIEFKEDIDDK